MIISYRTISYRVAMNTQTSQIAGSIKQLTLEERLQLLKQTILKFIQREKQYCELVHEAKRIYDSGNNFIEIQQSTRTFDEKEVLKDVYKKAQEKFKNNPTQEALEELRMTVGLLHTIGNYTTSQSVMNAIAEAKKQGVQEGYELAIKELKAS